MRSQLTATDGQLKKQSSLGLTALRVVALLLVVGLSIFIFTIRGQAEKLGAYGYPGIFLISILANATVVVPAPGVALVFAMGSVLNPLLVGLVAGAGAAVGEISGYIAGFSGQAVIQRVPAYDQVTVWMRRYGALTTLVLAAVPNPFFDLAGMAAGALKLPIQQFFFWCLLGKIIKMLIFAYTGAYSMDLLSGLIH